MQYRVSCHCGAFRATVEAPERLELVDCNCSICALSGHLHLIVPASRFHVEQGQDALTEYRFNTRVARHFFCRTCGIRPYYIARSNPDGIDVNARCLSPQPEQVEVLPFDGQNWEANAGTLASLSHEP